MLNFIQPTNFSAVSSLFDLSNTVFIIPTFQRPYAWIDKHVDALLSDINKVGGLLTSRRKAYHYLSPVHLIKVEPSDIKSGGILALGEFAEWQENEDLIALSGSSGNNYFLNERGGEINVYYVIDGQQRLTTFYLLEHFRLFPSSNTTNLYQQLNNSDIVPRLIQNPIDDHRFFKALCAQINGGPISKTLATNTTAQKRMFNAAERIENWIKTASTHALQFIGLPDFAISLICLKPDFGLSSFMTLNDRGKQLTVLEKFKALLLEYIIFYSVPISIVKFHQVFGDLYVVLDRCIDLGFFSDTDDAGDRKLMQLISIYVRTPLGGAARGCLEQSGDEAVDKYFKPELSDGANTSTLLHLIDGWLVNIDHLVKQLDDLSKFIFWGTSSTTPSLHFSSSTLADDYKAVLFSLSLNPGAFVLLLKFRELFVGINWHDRIPIRCRYDNNIKVEMKKYLGEMRHDRAIPPELQKYLKELDEQVEKLPDESKECDCEISMLEIVERLQMFIWNRGNPQQNFLWNYAATIMLPTASDFIQKWVDWYQSGVGSVSHFLRENGYNNFDYLLREYERSFGNNSIHVNGSQLEHIFSQRIDENSSFQSGGGFSSIRF
jgi:hypothetical protein